MSTLLLDTTFLIDAERTGDELDSMIDDADDVAIAAITVAELRVGVELASRTTRSARQDFVDAVMTDVPIIDYDLSVAHHARQASRRSSATGSASWRP